MAVQFNYLARKGWKPKNEDKDYLITLLKVEFSKAALREARNKKTSMKKLFESGDYDRAQDLFATVLLDNSDQYFTEAYVGLGWNSIYKANTLRGASNWSDRQYERDMSDEYFILADEHINADEIICPVIDGACSILCENLLVGKIYNSSYLALEASRQFYDNGLDPIDWEAMEAYSDSTLLLSDKLFNECNSLYVFDHDATINYTSIRILRAQTHVRLGDFENAELELSKIEDLLCDIKNLSAVQCLDRISMHGYDCTADSACNYNSNAVRSYTGNCIYPAENHDCEGDCCDGDDDCGNAVSGCCPDGAVETDCE